jgi:SAM-dependent methyltransferase
MLHSGIVDFPIALAQSGRHSVVGQTMRLPNLDTLVGAANRSRGALWGVCDGLYRKFLRRPLPGEYQPYYFTRPDRYPWLFGFAAARLATRPDLRILSFGCSRGEEVFSLRRYFPTATLKGIDINPRKIARCQARARAEHSANITFAVAATTQGEPTAAYDAIFCLAVLCNGDLTTSGAECCAPLLHFDKFDWLVGDFARCLKPGGLLALHTTNFRFCDTRVARDFDVVLEADPAHLAPDVQFGRDNRLLRGERYRAVVFEKRWPPHHRCGNDGKPLSPDGPHPVEPAIS